MNIGFQLFRAHNRMLSLVLPTVAAQRASKLFFTPRRHNAKAWELEAESRGRRFTLPGGLSGIRWGDGIPVLMMHGWEGRATQMAGFADRLLPLGYQVIALDGPAHGHSQGRQANPIRFVQAMLAADRALGPFHAVLGHSMGGGSALYALGAGLRADKAIVIAGPASFKTVSTRFARYIGLSQPGIARFVEVAEQHVGVAFEQVDLVQRIGTLRQELLLIHDRDDREIPCSDAQQLADAAPGSRLLLTEGLGHRQIMRAEQVIETVARFIDQPGSRVAVRVG